MLVKDVLGLKFPDEYLTRFFFKESLNNKRGKVLDLGSGNGNNSVLFYQYGWDVVGVDISSSVINNALENFSKYKDEYRLQNAFTFICDDMVNFTNNHRENKYDSLIFASSIYYMHPDKISELLKNIRDNEMLVNKADIYIRIRTTADYRFGKGKPLGNNTFKLDISETDEEGCEVAFFNNEKDFLELFCKQLPLEEIKTMRLVFDNYQNNKLIANSDIVIFGKYKQTIK